ncbi:MAG TPA: hypothetical protein PLU30_17745 [Verrucomicrobiae bacterium]|nr:hypothetical protein [Verrucomicrobiae bacterium]
MHDVWIRRGEAQFGPLTPDEVFAQFEQGVILAGDVGRFGYQSDWVAMPELLQRLKAEVVDEAPVARRSEMRSETMGDDTVTPAQVLRLQALGVASWEAARLNRREAAALIARAEETVPAGRALLGKMERMGLPMAAGISIAEAKRRLESASLRHYLVILDAKGIPYTPTITAAEAEELAEVGPPTERQRQMVAEMGLRPPANIGQRSLDRLLTDAARIEADTVEEFFALASRSPKCRGITHQQVRNVIRYLNSHFPEWREQEPKRRFFSFVAKFYPHLSGGSPTTRFLG